MDSPCSFSSFINHLHLVLVDTMSFDYCRESLGVYDGLAIILVTLTTGKLEVGILFMVAHRINDSFNTFGTILQPLMSLVMIHGFDHCIQSTLI